MTIDNALWLNYAVALGIGLLIGAERERNNVASHSKAVAGIRTFTIAALLGAVSITVNFWLLVVSLVCTTIFTSTAYFLHKEDDPGLTTEMTLIFTVILGALAMSAASFAASLAVAAAILLAAKEPIHAFVRGVITKEELGAFLTLAAATLIVLPLVPNEFIGPYDAINPRNLWVIVILVMSISAFGHLALRLLGGRIGLPLVGLVSGFISSIATIGAMGERVKQSPALVSAAAAGAVLSSLATIFQLTMILAAIEASILRALAPPLLAGGLSIAIYGAIMTWSSFRKHEAEISKPGRSFSVKTAFTLAAVIALVLVTSAALKAWFGQAGLVVGTALAGLADVHAAAMSVASLVASNKLSASAAVLPILIAFSANTLSKAIMAVVSGGRAFALQVIPPLVLQVSAIWIAWFVF